jgi:hypothetical protein
MVCILQPKPKKVSPHLGGPSDRLGEVRCQGDGDKVRGDAPETMGGSLVRISRLTGKASGMKDQKPLSGWASTV